MAVDVGTVRVGVARSDPDGILAVPETTLPRNDATMAGVAGLASSYDAIVIYVGLPLTLGGDRGLAAEAALAFAEALAPVSPCPIRMVDERLSTVTAQRELRDAGRRSKDARPVIDQAAAVLILEHALALERASGNPAGSAVTFGSGGGEEAPA